MPKRKTPGKKQQPITELALPLLKKPLEQIGKQINVPSALLAAAAGLGSGG